ncbi:MAG TPA: SCO family protein [Candidatus Binatia bacterium]|nr:SCO family protein [Candidatus Binatia bacterium]
MRRARLAVLLLGCAALVAGVWAGRHWSASRAPELRSGVLLQPRRAIAEFSLQDQDGRPFGRERLRGHWTLLFAGYTHCPDVCPATLALMKSLQRTLAGQGRAPHMLFLSVDPERDAPARLKDYVAAFDPAFEAVTGPAAQIDALCASLGLAYARVPEGSGYSLDHSAALTLIDADARVAGYFQPPFDLPALAADLGRVVAGS